MSYTVKLIHFTSYGKYYTDGEYVTEHEHMFQIFDEVKKKSAVGDLPGMRYPCYGYFTLVEDVVGNEMFYPALIMPSSQLPL
jgi:hypothetical protein